MEKVRYILLMVFFVLNFMFKGICIEAAKYDNIYFERISIEEGLSQSSVYCIIQDKQGFMWFATQEGLNRFDGYEFKVYKHKADENSLSDNYIWCILEDRDGILWIGTDHNGLNKMDPITGIIQRFPQIGSAVDDENSGKVIRTLFEDNQGNLLVGTGGSGIYKFVLNSNRFEPYANEANLDSSDIRAITEDSSGFLWVGTYRNGLYKIDKTSKEVFQYKHNSDNLQSLSNDKVMALCTDNSGVLWIGTEGGGLDKIDPKTNHFKHFKYDPNNRNSISNNNILSIYKLKDGKLWIGTDGGGLNILEENGDFISYQNQTSVPHSISNNKVWSIYEDRSGVIWVGTYTGGVNRYNPKNSFFSLFQKYSDNSEGLSDNQVRTFYQDESGTMWVGTESGGLNKIVNVDGKRKIKVQKDANKKLKNLDIRGIIEDNNDILIATRGGGLKRVHNKDFSNITSYINAPDISNSISGDMIGVLYKDEDEDIWIGTEGHGLNRLIKETGTFEHLGPHDVIIYDILKGHSDNLWMGTRRQGLIKLNINSKIYKAFKHKQDEKSLSHNFVLCIHESKAGTLWVGTYGGGLNKLIDREEGIFMSYRKENGLPNNTIYGILEDNEGNLWMSTNHGISRFNLTNGEFRNFDVYNGLQSNEFNSGAYYINKQGKMFFGGFKGFNSFFPSHYEQSRISQDPPNIAITSLKFYGQKDITTQKDRENEISYLIYSKKNVILPYKDNDFFLEFSVLHYGCPQKNKYQYALEGPGHDGENWTSTDWKNRRAPFTNLNPGKYVFKVRGCNEDGIWSEKPASITITIEHPWWSTLWAKMIYALIIFGILYLLWYVWSRRYQRRETIRIKHELEATLQQLNQTEKMRALGDLVANIAHEINNPASFAHTTAYNLNRDLEKLRTFLIELAGDEADKEILDAFAEKFEKLFKHLETIQEGTIRIKNIVGDLRTFSQRDRGEMKKVDLHKGLHATINLVKAKYKIHVKFVTNFNGPLEVIGNLPRLNQVFMNIIDNACSAILQKLDTTQDRQNKTIGTLTIQTKIDKKNVKIIFKDDGVGMPEDVKNKMFEPFFSTKPETHGMGRGLAVSYGIIKDHNGKFEVESKEENGTTVSIILPVEQPQNHNN